MSPRAVTMKLWEPKRRCSKAVPNTPSRSRSCGHGPLSVVWSHMSPGLQLIAISMNFYSCGSSHMIKWNKPTVARVWSVTVSRFCVRHVSILCWVLLVINVGFVSVYFPFFNHLGMYNDDINVFWCLLLVRFGNLTVLVFPIPFGSINCWWKENCHVGATRKDG
jgi:hypothetical protein